jgi:hypothetical protein
MQGNSTSLRRWKSPWARIERTIVQLTVPAELGHTQIEAA